MSRRVRELINSLLTELNQKELAEMMGVSVRTVYAWRHGENEPSPSSLERLEFLADSFNEYEESLGPDDYPEPERVGDTDVFNVAGMDRDEIADFIESLNPRQFESFRLIVSIPPTPEYPRGRTGTPWFDPATMNRRQLEGNVNEKGGRALLLLRTSD